MNTSRKIHTKKLSEVANIQTGYRLTKYQSVNPTEYEYQLFGESNPKVLYYSKQAPECFLTNKNDIIININDSKDMTFVDAKDEGRLIDDKYIIIRSMSKCLVPDYLYWILCNQYQKELQKISKKAVLLCQKVAEYSNIRIKLPNQEEQKLICEIAKILNNSMETHKIPHIHIRRDFPKI